MRHGPAVGGPGSHREDRKRKEGHRVSGNASQLFSWEGRRESPAAPSGSKEVLLLFVYLTCG